MRLLVSVKAATSGRKSLQDYRRTIRSEKDSWALLAASKVHAGAKVFEARQPPAGSETEVGFITSSVKSPGLGKEIALAYISMRQVVPGATYLVKVEGKNIEAGLSTLPFLV